MTVDYLSTLNKNGSGLNITQIVDSIVQAEIEPKRASIEKKSTETETKVSELAVFKSKVADFEDALSNLNLSDVFKVSPTTNSAVSYTPNANFTNVTPFTADVQVTQLAQAQTLEYSGYTSKTQVLSDTTLSISFGSVTENVFTEDTSRSAVTVSLTSPTLEELAAELTNQTGITAEIIQTDTGQYSLAIYSETGAENALSISGDATINTTDYASVQKQSAQNSKIQINGIEIERATNIVDGILSEGTLTLNEVTSSALTLKGEYSSEGAEEKLQAFVDTFNELNTYLTDVTQRDTGSGAGTFAADTAIRAVKTAVNSILRSPIAGFSDTNINLSEMGISTNRDGSITLNKATLETYFDANASKFMSLGENAFTSSDVNLSVSVADTKSQTAGTFTFSYDAGTSIASLNGNILTATTSGSTTTFTSSAAGFESFSISVETANIPTSATISVGVSMSEKFTNLTSDLLSSTGTIQSRESDLDDLLSDYAENLSDLTLRETNARERYLEQFTEMERNVTSLKSTSEYITALLDAWNNENK